MEEERIVENVQKNSGNKNQVQTLTEWEIIGFLLTLYLICYHQVATSYEVCTISSSVHFLCELHGIPSPCMECAVYYTI